MRLELSLELPSDPQSSARARLAVAMFLGDLGWDALIPVAALLVSELVTNSFCHASSPIGLRASAVGETLRVEVHDASPLLARLREPNGGGRGLHIVDAMATRWGSSPTDGVGKVTWFELRRD